MTSYVGCISRSEKLNDMDKLICSVKQNAGQTAESMANLIKYLDPSQCDADTETASWLVVEKGMWIYSEDAVLMCL